MEFKQLIQDRLVLVSLSAGKISPEHLREQGARDVLMLDPKANTNPERTAACVTKRYTRIPDVRKNNCNVGILHGRSSFALLQKRQFAGWSHVLLPSRGIALIAAILALARYGRRGIISNEGMTSILVNGRPKRYMVLGTRVRLSDRSRLYGPAGCSPLEILQRLSGLNYVVLRSREQIEQGEHKGDIDILISQNDLHKIKEKFEAKIGTYPVDVYTDLGQEGHSYKSVPYFTLHLARGMLESSFATEKGVRTTTPYWQYLSYCYHLLFHNKSEKTPENSTSISETTFSKPSYYHELKRLADSAGMTAPATFDDLEKTLHHADAMPSLDLIGFYSDKNPFLKHRYFYHTRIKAGLATFFIRDFGKGAVIAPIVRKRLLEHFKIIAEGPVDDSNRDQIIRGVRGGNWTDHSAPSGIAEPVYWFVCWDSAPHPPSSRTKRKHPRVDNERIRLKDELRHDLVDSGEKAKRIIHSSDNSFEALDHLKCLGLQDHPEIKRLLFDGN